MSGSDGLFKKNKSPNDMLFGVPKPLSFSKISSENISKSDHEFWKVLIVDDEADIHQVTKLALGDFEYNGKKLKFVSATSAVDARKILDENPDIALAFLDVVMETNTAGLDLVRYIREEQNNHIVSIVLRTGQPGSAPEKDVILKYEINDYKSKTELTSDKLFSCTVSSLRSYQALILLEEHNADLEKKVQQRTLELSKTNFQITESINYAKQLQNSLLPTAETLNNYFKENIILYKPRDIVSGDFYWFAKSDEYLFFAVADCTGHGVPGGFVSMITLTLLNEIIKYKRIYDTSEILKQLNDGIIGAFGKTDNFLTSVEDGAEMTIMRVDYQSKKMEISSGGSGAFVCQNGVVHEILPDCLFYIGDSFSIGKDFEFKKYTFDITQDTVVYQFSDGIQDQFGGEKMEKYSYHRLKEIVTENCCKNLSEQKQIIENSVSDWMNKGAHNEGDKQCKQIDDITLTAIRF